MTNFSNSLSSVFRTRTTKYLRKRIFGQSSSFYIMTLPSQTVSFTRQFSAKQPITVLTSIFARSCLTFLNTLWKTHNFLCRSLCMHGSHGLMQSVRWSHEFLSPSDRWCLFACSLVLMWLRPIRHLFCSSVYESGINMYGVQQICNSWKNKCLIRNHSNNLCLMSATFLKLNRLALSATWSTSLRGGWYKQRSRHYRRTALLHTEGTTSPWQLT